MLLPVRDFFFSLTVQYFLFVLRIFHFPHFYTYRILSVYVVDFVPDVAGRQFASYMLVVFINFLAINDCVFGGFVLEFFVIIFMRGVCFIILKDLSQTNEPKRDRIMTR